MHLEGSTTMTHTWLHSGVSPLAAAAFTGAVAPAQVVDKEPNRGSIAPALAREIAVAAVRAEGSRGRPSGARVGRAGR
jgi:hypothetical protein